MKAEIVMIALAILLFSIIVVLLSFLVARSEVQDRGKAAVSAALIAWGSLFYGLVLAKCLL
jgi:hypothetical protein